MTVNLTIDDHVEVIEWNRPPANHFDRELLVSIADAGGRAQDEGARAVVLASVGKHFCADVDFAAGQIRADPHGAISALYEAGKRIFALEIPVVAAVQGAAVGGGLGLACAADFRVATARLMQTADAAAGIEASLARETPRFEGR
ncbi:enoyl-CoA hydratase/isomerase-like protein [Yimella lutea]|uniref:Enoyl-CoA hydratase/isomerase-like protein n=1 Tax=Yimella lutea TaxID=587872 RepID=A0A542EDX2_9MICO|nr:enoyl-CoA hydratase-related protein [Yimella lutea]TQJ13500.1 enoyl-CoA hydratase/isomerase-like protein [Yimella lutea]